MSHNRRLLVGTAAAGAVLIAATGAAAQDSSSIDVSARSELGSRQFYVEDLAGATLTGLDLGSGTSGAPFQTRVQDSSWLSPEAGFSVSAEMTNLYRYTGSGSAKAIDHGVKVDSKKVSVGFVGVPTDVSGVSLGAVPRVQVAGAMPACGSLKTLLPADSPLLGSGSLLGGTLALLGLSDAAAPLCTALGGATATTGTLVEPVDAVVVPLQEQLLNADRLGAAALPVSLGVGNGGAFDKPSFKGDGAGDGAKPSGEYVPTSHTLISGSKNSALDVKSLVSSLLDTMPLFPAVPGGTGALTTTSSVVDAMLTSPDPAVVAVGKALAGLSAKDQTAVLSGMVPGATPVASLLDASLQRISGNYRSFPRLQADLTGAPAGTYTGTMTVTFVQK
ncbi:MAG TPA: hypothetical protein VM433_13445 [Mycobacteriales bacterium]|nr:hypothetical protein [Mycobacteriales bacterium]